MATVPLWLGTTPSVTLACSDPGNGFAHLLDDRGVCGTYQGLLEVLHVHNIRPTLEGLQSLRKVLHTNH